VLFAAGGVVWYYRRQIDKDREASEVEESGTVIGSESDDGEFGAAAGGTGASEPTGGSTGDTSAPAPEMPEELLSPEERVLQLLEHNGGRMKQKSVTEELDWSAARTSQVVGDLRDDGEVESFRLGRENVLKFPDDTENE